MAPEHFLHEPGVDRAAPQFLACFAQHAAAPAGMGCIFFLDQGDSHVQSAAPKIKNEINMARLDMRAIAQRGSGRLVNQPESPQTGGFQHARQPIDIMLIRFDGHGQRHFLVAHLQFLDRKQKDRRKKISARIEMEMTWPSSRRLTGLVGML